jgi:hypothetical protein
MSRIAAGMICVVVAITASRSAWAEDECIPIETFAGAAVDSFPAGWRARKDDAKRVYLVKQEGDRKFLQADAQTIGQQAAKPHEWNLDQYPVLAWSWRPRVFPTSADERTGKNDSALSVYFMVPYSRIRGPKAVKYVWSQVVPVGTRLSSNGGLTQVRVLRSSSAASEQWTDERVNVRDDYKAYFEEKGTPKPAGIAVLTDGDDTSSRAAGDYSNFRACRR